MALAPGSVCGPYEILSLIGEGGMGRVFRARDTKLKRDVAIKALPDEFAGDPARVARFQREAEALAALNHPHIAGIHDLVEAGGERFLVLELVEGETLADRIRRGPVGLDEALRLTRQIADALETAHEHGIVHRDLKPANIKITPDGQVKVLDFGLAKMHRADAAAAAALSQSPTMLTGTALGVILGTATYMSPEQARGKEADRTSDVWAFGCLLYEMLTGRPVFEGESIGEVLGGIFKQEPDWTRLPAETPPAIRRLLRRALAKDRVHRLHDMADARIEIEEAQRGARDEPDAARSGPRGRERWAWLVAAGSLVAVAIMTLRPFLSPARVVPEMRVEINTPTSPDPVSLAISPDGEKLVFVAAPQGAPRLWLRLLSALTASPLAGTDGATFPFWSPDSRFIAFFADGKLKTIEIAGGPARTIANALIGRGGAWGNDDVILFAPTTPGPLFRVPAAGGEPEPVTRVSSPQASHRFPELLPDGRHFLFYEQQPATGPNGIYVGSFDGSATRLVDSDSAAVLSSSGHLLFARQGTLVAQTFDLERRVLAGDPVSVADQVAVDLGRAGVSASPSGPFVYRSAVGGGVRQLAWFDRTGRQIGTVGPADVDALSSPELSPDGRHVAVERRVSGNREVWIIDTAQGLRSRFTSDAADDAMPVWSPDGRRIVFTSNRKGSFDLFEKPSNAASSETLVVESPKSEVPMAISSDGRFILYRTNTPSTGFDLWAVASGEPGKPFPVVQTGFTEDEGQFSPDGKWVAYQSNESGQFEIIVQSFPGPGGKGPVSRNGGAQPRWRPDGKELFYISLDRKLMAVPLTLDSLGQRVETGPAVALFQTPIPGGAVQSAAYKQQYSVSPDGQRFLINTIVGESATSSITLILNFKAR